MGYLQEYPGIIYRIIRESKKHRMSKLFIDRVPSPVPIPALPPRGSRLDGAEGCLFVRPALRPARTAWCFCALVIRDIPGYSILKGWLYQKI